MLHIPQAPVRPSPHATPKRDGAPVPTAFEGACLDGLLQALSLGAAPDVVARGMSGLDRPESHDVRRRLEGMGASPFALALSTVGCRSERADFLRARIAAEHRDPSSAALGLAGCGREILRPFCRALVAQGADEEWAALGLAGCEDDWSFAFRTTLRIRVQHRRSRRHIALQRIALGLAGCDGHAAHERRDALRRLGPFLSGPTAESLRGCASDAAHARRLDWLSSAPHEIGWSLVGQEAPRDHQLRRRLLKTLRDPAPVLRSLAGCDGPSAWILRKELGRDARVSARDMAASLARCPSDRARALRERLFAGHALTPDDMVDSLVGIHDPHRAFWPWTRPHALYALS